MPNTRCVYLGCHKSKKRDGVIMYRFPRDEERSKKWVEASKNPKLIGQSPEFLNKHYLLCHHHFSDWCFMNPEKKRLVCKAVPDQQHKPAKTDVTQAAVEAELEELIDYEYRTYQIGECIIKTSKEEKSSEDNLCKGNTSVSIPSTGAFLSRDMPLLRKDYNKRAYTVGVGGPVGSGKTALILALCRYMREDHSLCVITNDICSRADCEYLIKNKALQEHRIKAVETKISPHAAIKEDCSLNLEAVRDMTKIFKPEIVFLESGGDSLGANFSRELADYIIFVIDVVGGDKIPGKGGAGITESDLLVINKTDLAQAVGADLQAMQREALAMRHNGPVTFVEAKHMKGIADVACCVLKAYRAAMATCIE